jgi:hypothetical protein
MRRDFIRAAIPFLFAALVWGCKGKQPLEEAYAATNSGEVGATGVDVTTGPSDPESTAEDEPPSAPETAGAAEDRDPSRRLGYNGVADARSSRNGEPSVILVRSFHDRNFNGIQDPGEEELDGRALRVTDPDLRTFTLYMPTMIVAREAGTYTLVEVTPDGARQTMRGLNGTTLSLHPDADPVVAVFVDDPSKKSGTHTVSYGYVGLGQVRACKILDEDGDGVAESGERGLRGWWIELSGTDAQGETVRPVVRTTGDDGCVTFTGLLPGDYTVSEAVPAAGASETNDTASHEVTIASSISGSSLAGSVDTVNFTLSRNIGLRYQNLLTDDATSDTASSTRHR